MAYKFEQPIRVGDLDNSILVDALEIQSVSLTFDPQLPVLSIVLVHKPSGWQHVVTYTDSSAVEFWARTFESQFDYICQCVIQKLVTDSKLPTGTLDPIPSSSTVSLS